MGRKKIEIKPLTDERNRNVTFLKRKAGLMKKAYELSVLCGVTVSILIFSQNGKPYEFSSGDFDTEVDRYNEYEGTIERRRAAEFEAMAKAGEDDDDDEDEDDTKPGKAKPNGPSKSLKGKESFKSRRVPVKDTADRRGGGGSRRDRSDRDRPDESFVGALVDDGDSAPQSPRRRSDSAAGLQYALGLHQQQASNAPPVGNTGGPSGLPWNAYRPSNVGVPFGFPFGSQGSSGPPFLPTPGASAPPLGGVPMGGSGGWDNSMLTTYAWLQIQQAHQEQKRHLLEKQQQQLLELTSRSGGHALFRDILGPAGNMGGGGGGSGSGGGGGGGGAHVAHPGHAAAAGLSAALNEFVWPTAPATDEPQVSTPPDEDLIWALSGGGANLPAGAASHGHNAPPQQQPYGIDYPLTMDGKRRADPRDMFAAAAAAKRRK